MLLWWTLLTIQNILFYTFNFFLLVWLEFINICLEMINNEYWFIKNLLYDEMHQILAWYLYEYCQKWSEDWLNLKKKSNFW